MINKRIIHMNIRIEKLSRIIKDISIGTARVAKSLLMARILVKDVGSQKSFIISNTG